jgi:dUTP pyrophosphatase
MKNTHFDYMARMAKDFAEAATMRIIRNANIIMFKRLNGNANTLPSYKSEEAAGMDLSAHLSEPVTIFPTGTAIIPTGLAMAIRKGFEGQIRSRSGLAANNKVFVLNSPGTIDSDYRGELKIILTNAGEDPFTINNGDRIAQLVISPVVQMHPFEVEELDDTARGEGGFGSTGVK